MSKLCVITLCINVNDIDSLNIFLSCAAIVLVVVKLGFELLCICLVEGAEEQYIYMKYD